MIRDIPPLAVEGFDPWEKVQIDTATRHLAEAAAAAAALSVEEWLERAIRRACPSAFRSANLTLQTASIAPQPVAAPIAAAPVFTPPPALSLPVTPLPVPVVTPATSTHTPDIEASLQTLLAMVQRQAQAQPQAQLQPEAVVQAQAPMQEPPLASLRDPSIGDRLAQGELEELEDDDIAAPQTPRDDFADHEDDDEPRLAPRMMYADQDEDAAETAPPPRKGRFKLWATARRDEKPEKAFEAEDEPLVPMRATSQRHAPSHRNNILRMALIAIGAVVAVVVGVLAAQILIPSRSSLSHTAPAPSSTSSSNFAPTSNNSSLPSFDSSGTPSNASGATGGVPSLPPSNSAMPLSNPVPHLGNGSSSLSVPGNLPPGPDLPSLTPATPAPAHGPGPVPAPDSSSLVAPPVSPLPNLGSAPPMAPLATATPAKPNLPVAKESPAKEPNGKQATAAETPAADASSASGQVAIATIGKNPANDTAPTDPKQLASWLEQRAKTGDAIAQYRLGVLYALGQGVQQDYQHAASLFKSSAQAGVAEAQYNIAVMYGQGLGIGIDPTQAVQWYQKAASQGNANAAFNLGVAYSKGVGVTQSMDEAAQWFRRAAAAGIVNAQFNLGVLYERGDGVPVSQVEAYAWFSAAAAHGDSGAAERRDHLASTLSPPTLKEAQARAQQVAATVQNNANSNSPGGLATTTTAGK